MEEVHAAQVQKMLSSWMFDLHRAGRSITSETQREVHQIAALVVGAGGTLREAFSAARSLLQPPASLEEANS
jgi:hypothetical protein